MFRHTVTATALVAPRKAVAKRRRMSISDRLQELAIRVTTY